jgi:hypothetical protein
MTVGFSFQRAKASQSSWPAQPKNIISWMEESVKKKEVARKYRSNGEMVMGLTLNGDRSAVSIIAFRMASAN